MVQSQSAASQTIPRRSSPLALPLRHAADPSAAQQLAACPPMRHYPSPVSHPVLWAGSAAAQSAAHSSPEHQPLACRRPARPPPACETLTHTTPSVHWARCHGSGSISDLLGWFPGFDRDQKRALGMKWQRAKEANEDKYAKSIFGDKNALRADASWEGLCDLLRVSVMNEDYQLICDTLDNHFPAPQPPLQKKIEKRPRQECHFENGIVKASPYFI
jgi:hypothetical protein